MTTALELHEQVFRGIDPEAGMWRGITVFLQGSRHTPPRAESVIPSMSEWEREYSQRDIVGERVFTLAAWMHHRFESIHPFRDGNGRVGRLLLTYTSSDIVGPLSTFCRQTGKLTSTPWKLATQATLLSSRSSFELGWEARSWTS